MYMCRVTQNAQVFLIASKTKLSQKEKRETISCHIILKYFKFQEGKKHLEETKNLNITFNIQLPQGPCNQACHKKYPPFDPRKFAAYTFQNLQS